MSWNWSSAKCSGRKAFGTWYNIVICAMLCVNFFSKSKATNISPKHILKSKALDKINQARKKSFCHVILKNYLCNVLRKNYLCNVLLTWLYCGWTVRSSHRRFSVKKLFLKSSQYPQETPVLESLFKNVADLKAWKFIKKRPHSSVFLWILQSFFENYRRTTTFLLFQWFTVTLA